jgi:hypothetical protein
LPIDEQLALTLDPRSSLYTLRRQQFYPLCHADVADCPDACTSARMNVAPFPTSSAAAYVLDMSVDFQRIVSLSSSRNITSTAILSSRTFT